MRSEWHRQGSTLYKRSWKKLLYLIITPLQLYFLFSLKMFHNRKKKKKGGNSVLSVLLHVSNANILFLVGFSCDVNKTLSTKQMFLKQDHFSAKESLSRVELHNHFTWFRGTQGCKNKFKIMGEKKLSKER